MEKKPLVESSFSMERGVYLAFHHGKISSGKMIGKLNLNFANHKKLIFIEIGWGKLFFKKFHTGNEIWLISGNWF